MICRAVDDNTISVIAEDADDLLSLRRVVKLGDKIIGDTTRVIRPDREYSRPDRGERVRIRISLQVERISLDSAVDRLRIAGTILESGNEAVPHGSHHSMLIKAGDPVAVFKKKWSRVERRLVETKNDKTGFVLVAIDKADCGIGRLNGTHLDVMPNIYSGSGGKRYKTDFNIERFFEEVSRAVAGTTRENDKIIVFGPGETKRKFANYAEGAPNAKNTSIRVVEGIDSGGEDGIYTFTKSETMREIMSDSKIARIADIVDCVMSMAGRQSRKFTMGFEETSRANRYGAIESLVFSDKVLENEDEEGIIEFLNDAESRGTQIFSVDSSTDLGLRVTGLGGIIATLRFPIETGA